MFDDLAKPAPRDDTGNRTGDIRNAIPMSDTESVALDKLLAAQGALKKNPSLLAKYSDPRDILAVVGADGQLSLSGVGKLNAANVEMVQNRDMDLKARMSAITNTLDIRERQSLLNSFQADFAEQLSKDIQGHRGIAEDRSGVPQLRAQLIASEASDRNDPLYYKYQRDSTGTSRLRQALMQAEDHARSLTKDMVAQDPQLSRNHALVTNFLDTENKNIARLLQKSEATDMQIEQETAGLTTDNLAVIAAEYPNKSTEELKRIIYGLKTNPVTRREYAAVFDPSATPEDYAVAAVAGMKPVLPYVIKEQSLRTGQSPEQVRTDIARLQSLINNDTSLHDVVKQFGTAAEKKQFADMLGKHMIEKGKEVQDAWRKTKLDWAMAMQQNIAQSRISGDVKNWQAVNGIAIKDIPEVKAIIDRYEVAGKKVGIVELLDTFVKDVPRGQQAERFKLLKDHYSANIDANNKGLYGIIAKDSAMKAFEARFVGSNFFDDLNRVREMANESKPLKLDPNAKFPPVSNIDLSTIKVSDWLKEGTVNAGSADNIYTKPSPAKAKLNEYYNEQGAVFNAADLELQANPKLRAAIDSAKASKNIEDRR